MKRNTDDKTKEGQTPSREERHTECSGAAHRWGGRATGTRKPQGRQKMGVGVGGAQAHGQQGENTSMSQRREGGNTEKWVRTRTAEIASPPTAPGRI